MKRISTIALIILLTLLMADLMPARVFADSLPEYISEVKVFYDDYKNAEKEGFTVLKGDNGKPVNLNQGAGGGWGSKGDKSVYLGYKTTKDAEDGITDLALMNMKGGYDVAEYEALMESQMKAQIIPFVENFLSAIREYRENVNSEYQQLYGAKNLTCAKISIGLGIAFVLISAITVYLSYRDMKAYYKVDFTPIPHYMVEEKDIVGYNRNCEKIVLKNQSAYYKAVESNLKEGDFKFDEIGAVALTGGAGLALGALATAIGMTASKKKKENAA